VRKAKYLRWLGWFLLLTGLGALAFYWLVLLPILFSSHYGLDEDHSATAFWKKKQWCLKMGIVFHDDGWYIGKLGDKEWFLRVLDRIKHNDGLSCAGGHMDVALNYLTNQDFGDDSDVVQKAETWWDAHKYQTQEEWVREGFEIQGVHIAMPPPAEEWPKLLNILGKKSAIAKRVNGEMAYEYQDHLRYNAYRTLRDAGFDPVTYLIGIHGERLEPELIDGLNLYMDYGARFGAPAIATFSFANPDKWSGLYLGVRPPQVANQPFRIGVTCGCLIAALLGVLFIRLGGRCSLKSIQKSAVDDPVGDIKQSTPA
jgi:hypothetical protein